jgi:hypothetical protein
MNPFIKKALCNRLADQARRKVAQTKEYRKKYDFLNQPIDVWENKHFTTLAETLIKIDVNTIKRLFEIKGYEDSENVLSRKSSRDAVAIFLGYKNWDTLDNDLIAEASAQINKVEIANQKQQFADLQKEVNQLKSQLADLFKKNKDN